MDDLEIDRTLRAMLSEEPSPEFVARVRTRLAEAPRPSIVAGWLKPATAVACGALVVLAVGLPREHAQLKLSPTEAIPVTAGLKASTTTIQSGTVMAGLKASTTTVQSGTVMAGLKASTTTVQSGTVTAALKASTTTVQSGTAAVVVPAFRPARPARPAAAAHAANADERLPEVIIAAEDVEALRQLLVSLNEHTFVASFDETPVSTPWMMTNLSVSPIGGDLLDSPATRNN